MLNSMDKQLIKPILQIARDAGDAIMEVYSDDSIDFETKNDGDFTSPLTQADTAASNIIVKGLAELSELPIVNEENELSHTIYADEYWLVDPLDGTKEFIKKNNEFTVNIALIKDGQPVFGMVYAPALNVLYWNEGDTAHKQSGDDEPTEISVREPDPEDLVVVVSRSHINDTTRTWLDEHAVTTTTPSGSSLKLCLVAEGAADCYPRLAPTMIWDTGAAHAVLVAAGGEIIDQTTNKSLTYDLDQLRNNCFVCKAR